jgi:hypothetical protein
MEVPTIEATKARMDHMKRLKTIFLHFLIKGGTVDAQDFCCGTDIALFFTESLGYH